MDGAELQVLVAADRLGDRARRRCRCRSRSPAGSRRSRISSGVISDAPPIPVMPTSRPMPNPKRMIFGSKPKPKYVDDLDPWRVGGSETRLTSNRPLWSRLGSSNYGDRAGVLAGALALEPGLGVVEDRLDAPRQVAAATSARVTFSSTERSAARTATQTSRRRSAGPRVVKLLGRVLVDVRERALDRADHVGDRDLGRVAGEPVAAAGAAPRLDQARVLELEQDVLEELQRDALRLGQPLALDRLAVRGWRRARAPRAPRSRPWLRSAPADCRNSSQECRRQSATIPRAVIDLQSHSTVSDGQLEPADVARAAAEAGVTVMALTDHDGVAGVADGDRPPPSRLGIENVPAVEMSCVHKYSEDLHICGYWVDLERIAPACARAQQERVDRAKEIIANLNRHGVEVTLRGRGREGGRRRRDRPPPHRQGGRRRARPRAVLRGVPRPGREGVRLAQVADGRAGGRADPRRGRGRGRRAPYWDVQDPEQVRDLVESLVRDVGLDGIETFYPPHTAEQTKHCLELCEEFGLVADGLVGLPRPDPQDLQPLGRLRHLRPRRAAGAGEALVSGSENRSSPVRRSWRAARQLLRS